MSSLTPVQASMLSLLRGDRNERPQLDPELHNQIHSYMASELSFVEHRLVVEKRALQKIHQCEGLFCAKDPDFAWTTPMARGSIAHAAIELSIAGHRPATPMQLADAAMHRICERDSSQSLADHLRSIDDAERAELRSSVVDLVSAYTELFPPIPPTWRPVAEATTGAVVTEFVFLRGRMDLKLGQAQGPTPGSLILDFKTGTPNFGDTHDLRFYALVECLRIGVPPFRWANVYLDSGQLDQEDATEDLLWAAARRCVDGVKKMHALDEGQQPQLSPGPCCRFCPDNHRCPVALKESSWF